MSTTGSVGIIVDLAYRLFHICDTATAPDIHTTAPGAASVQPRPLPLRTRFVLFLCCASLPASVPVYIVWTPISSLDLVLWYHCYHLVRVECVFNFTTSSISGWF
ncbi:hypothetical protein CY34DRAFT_708514 [Suillus luteus UH-Slu-Lm8-n1]|uniref:Uncharacterized protein n=1 Tax=Suillus luteus UH-Slu-Lm8-n1 TaxID=930992 RepID=A0A0D0A0W8_9AGAM|nr:hypothetical protein CY34DRAFT_708514 [Suillus luteus UH-Slu-Lm8-n1]